MTQLAWLFGGYRKNLAVFPTFSYQFSNCHVTVLITAMLCYAHCSEILADFLMNMRETKLRGYKSAFMLSVVNNELFKDKGVFYIMPTMVTTAVLWYVKGLALLLLY